MSYYNVYDGMKGVAAHEDPHRGTDVIVTIEGMDRTGKSWLAERLASLGHGRVVHSGPPSDEPLNDYANPIQGYGMDDLIILDRYHWGERVWGPRFRDRDGIGSAGFMWLELALAARGGITVLAASDPHKIKQRLDDEGDNSWTVHDIAQVQYEFAALQNDAITPWYAYDMAHGRDSDNFAQRFLNGAKLRRSALALVQAVTDEYIGGPTPSILLVGEAIGGGPYEDKPACTLPFRPNEGTSGRYLMRTLQRTGIADYGIVNALDWKHDPRVGMLQDLWSALYSPNIVALGRTAQRVLTEANLPHGAVPHPQFIRRFHHDKMSAYAGAIKIAAIRLRDLIGGFSG